MKPSPLRNGDAAKRMFDAIRLHQVTLTRDEILNKRFIAVSLSDGSSDNTAYDSRTDAMRIKGPWVANYAYVQVPLQRLSVEACDVMLWYVKQVYEAGYRPEPQHELMMPVTLEDLKAML